MTRTLRTALLAATLVSLPAAARAQSGSIFVDLGQRKDSYGDQTKGDGTVLGFGYQMLLGGQSSKQAALLMPLTLEFRYAELGGTFNGDMNGEYEMLMRLGPVAVGGGIAGRLPYGNRKYTYDCTSFVDCPASGTDEADADDAISIGFSLSGKVSFGPQGRLFVQGKQVSFTTTLDARGSGTQCNDYGCIDTYAPELETGREQRASVGIVFPHKGDARILRASMIRQKWEYEHVQSNIQGGLDRESTMYTLGMVWTF